MEVVIYLNRVCDDTANVEKEIRGDKVPHSGHTCQLYKILLVISLLLAQDANLLPELKLIISICLLRFATLANLLMNIIRRLERHPTEIFHLCAENKFNSAPATAAKCSTGYPVP